MPIDTHADEMSESVTFIIEMDEEGSTRSMQTLNTYTAKDDSYSTSDLKPRFLDLSDIRKKLGVEAESREDRQEVLQELAEELWGRFREMAYTDLVSLAEKTQERADEIRHRICAEAEAADAGKISSEDCLFRGDHHYFAGFLSLQASLARQAVQAIEELGRVPSLEEVSRRTLWEAIETSTQNARGTEEVAQAMQEYFAEAEADEVPAHKKTFFKDEIVPRVKEAGRSLHSTNWKAIQSRIDGYCKEHGISVPTTPRDYRKILNSE